MMPILVCSAAMAIIAHFRSFVDIRGEIRGRGNLLVCEIIEIWMT